MECLGARRGLNSVHMFKEHVVVCLLAMNRDYSMLNQTQHLPNNSCSGVMKGRECAIN